METVRFLEMGRPKNTVLKGIFEGSLFMPVESRFHGSKRVVPRVREVICEIKDVDRPSTNPASVVVV